MFSTDNVSVYLSKNIPFDENIIREGRGERGGSVPQRAIKLVAHNILQPLKLIQEKGCTGFRVPSPELSSASYKYRVSDGPIRSYLSSLTQRLFTENSFQGDGNLIFSLFSVATGINFSALLIDIDRKFEPFRHLGHRNRSPDPGLPVVY